MSICSTNQGFFSEIDIHFARLITGFSEKEDPQTFLAAALVSSYTRQGHICLDLSRLEGKTLLKGGVERGPVTCPELHEWLKKLRESPAVGNPGQFKPLILDDRFRLYLYRYWYYQERIVDLIRGLVQKEVLVIQRALLKHGLERLFPSYGAAKIDWQKVAAFTALMKRFCVISGGPGTGKTTTIVKILVLLLEQAYPEKLRLGLVAPTGKAAARLQEAIKQEKEKLDCRDSVRDAIPDDASTIHRMLGSLHGSPNFHHHAENRLAVDVVVVDEASMVDLALMSKLIQAIPQQARLILSGDKDQLSSVEAGSVLGDICDTENVHSLSRQFCDELKKFTGFEIPKKSSGKAESDIRDCIIHLRESYRFDSDSGIHAVSAAVNEGDGYLAAALLKDEKFSDIRWTDLPEPKSLQRAIKNTIIQEYGDYLRASDPLEVFKLFDRFRILCALREGPYGVVAINSMAEKTLREGSLITTGEGWYKGKPVLITKNDYNLRLFNGDVGIILPDTEANNDLRVFFPAPGGSFRKLNPVRLPDHETSYAMTVHKSQGSEFERVLLILPDRDAPVLTRELIYTGITRTRESVSIWGTESVFRNAVSRRTERASGLRDALWDP
ncbi:MAG: exodeoxyribonuclease V subunit alpha [Thermodesulfobacteriota bacterium]|nr:exodeoxyribonuclease V subunit alpha [Thermodesulfobacteriota bacterium]